MNHLYSTDRSPHPGYRLHKLEVYNWGTFDSTRGDVHIVRPDGQTTLLIGRNGSGKSTLVDALLTLLVRPGVRNFNVAAGAQKRERDERTYIKGAYDRRSRDEDNRADVQFLRPDGSYQSVLLACFQNADSDDSFTVAQLLYLNSDGGAEKMYCMSPGERSIAADFARLASMERLRKQMEKRGFKATTSFTEYHSWFAKATGVQPKAMDVFNQTVAVKDIQSLNRFIRDHMLEAKPWGEKVDSLLKHFTELSEAHQSLLRVRRQSELLEPIAEKGAAYREEAVKLAQVQRLLDAADSFFRQKTVDLFTPECEARRRELTHVLERKEKLGHDIDDVREECRRFKNEIEQAGGERLRQIPLLIEKHETQAASKRDANGRYDYALRTAGFAETVADDAAFADVQHKLPSLLEKLAQEIAASDSQREQLVIDRAELSRTLKEDTRELESLMQRRENLPEAFAELRRRLCEDLRLPEKELPFVAELIAVKPEERAWEASIEMVLRNFGLSLLVPQRSYRVVGAYVNRTRLSDSSGRGQRLVYFCVGPRVSSQAGPPPHAQSLLRKLDFREGNQLLPWVKCELEERFDFLCCETMEEFQDARDLAMTRERHLKFRGVQHEKDDRDHIADPRNFVLGWDNREKRRRLAEEIERSRERLERLEREIRRLDEELALLRDRQTAIHTLEVFGDFSAIDFRTHEREIAALRLEKQQLEEQSDAIRMLKQRLAEAESRQAALQAARDEAVATARELEKAIKDGERLMANAKQTLRKREADGTLVRHAESFGDLEAWFTEQPLAAAELMEREIKFKEDRRAEVDRVRRAIEPLRSDLCAAMIRYLRDFADEQADLNASVEYLDSFLSLLDHIRREDLPRHEQRFKERLDEKVSHEIGLLNAALHTECDEIESKIELLNESLRKVEYRSGTYMRLEPRPVRDREITDFQNALKECLAETFEGTPEANEARFLRIEKFITRLRDEPLWRERVIDVRRWFDFAAREIDEMTLDERSYYEDSTGQSGGEKAKLAFTILVAAIAYQYDIDPDQPESKRFHFVIVDEMFSKVDDQYAQYALELFRRFGLQLLIVAPLDAKARVTEPYVGCYLHVVKDEKTNRSEIYSMTAREFQQAVVAENEEPFSAATAGVAKID